MSSSWLGLMELFVGAAVVLGWAVIELVILRRDKRRAAEQAAEALAGSADIDVHSGGVLDTDEGGALDATTPRQNAAR